MIVMKFGGTSVESEEAINRVAGIVKQFESRRPVVVVSAMGKTTNELLDIAREAAAGRRGEALAMVQQVRSAHLLHGLAVAGGAADELQSLLQTRFDWLQDLVRGLAIVRELSPRSSDAIASLGEQLSSLIVTFAFRNAGMRAEHVDSRDVVVTDDSFTHAQPIVDETYPRLRGNVRPIAEKNVVVMGGFIGSTVNGQTTTLGRGGSDFSASLIGAGLDAEEIQIWTDVDGMLTADPRIIAGGHRVKSISFAEAAEMAYFGAKVLHPATVLPAVEKNIPVLILNSRRPHVGGTKITANPTPCRNPVKSISCKRGVTIVNVNSSRMLMAHGFLRRMFEIFDRHGISVDMISTSEVSVSLTLEGSNELDEIVRELSEFASVRVENGQALVCLVGENIRHTPGIAARTFGAFEKNIRMISQGASEMNIGFVVADEEVPEVVGVLHREFFSELDPDVFE
ncbi:MAG: lysine-sensitive aspartokinase 3 [Bryobacteraceae bacterium]